MLCICVEGCWLEAAWYCGGMECSGGWGINTTATKRKRASIVSEAPKRQEFSARFGGSHGPGDVLLPFHRFLLSDCVAEEAREWVGGDVAGAKLALTMRNSSDTQRIC